MNIRVVGAKEKPKAGGDPENAGAQWRNLRDGVKELCE